MAKRGVLYSQGYLDVLPYYFQVSEYLVNFLKNKEIATKTELKNFKFLKRGSKDKPLFVEELKNTDANMLKFRDKHLDEIREKLTEKQVLIWQYFVPRKLVNFFYATNGENPGNPINRIFIDIDRQKHTSEDARQVCLQIVKSINEDKQFNKLLKFKTFIMWTGSSFHVYLLLKNKIDNSFYQKYLSYGRKEQSFIEKWAEQITKQTGISTKAGHERSKDSIILDSSNTPSGKLARAPFSLHIKDYQTIDGIAVPVSEQQLEDKNLIKNLKSITPEKVLKNIKRYAKLLN